MECSSRTTHVAPQKMSPRSYFEFENKTFRSQNTFANCVRLLKTNSNFKYIVEYFVKESFFNNLQLSEKTNLIMNKESWLTQQ